MRAVPEDRGVLGIGGTRAGARRERRWRATELADLAGISPRTLSKIEAGEPNVSAGIVFEVATLVGVPLFGVGADQLGDLAERSRDRLALLGSRVRAPAPVDDDF